jgi:hypothetical protein
MRCVGCPSWVRLEPLFIEAKGLLQPPDPGKWFFRPTKTELLVFKPEGKTGRR